MYTPAHFSETRVEVLHSLIRQHPLAALVTVNLDGGLAADHVPLLLDEANGLYGMLQGHHVPLLLDEANGLYGMLQGHVARANPVWNRSRPGGEVLAIFQGPQAYITPSWYATKPETGKVVPTWNYAVVHAYGPLRVVDDRDWLRSQVERLTAAQESGSPHPWAVADAPADFIERLLAAVVGVEIEITRLAGKWKVSQNQPDANRAGVIAGLRAIDSDNAREVADLIPPPGPA